MPTLASPIAGLRSLDLSFNRLASLPPALSAATALTALRMNYNDELRLTAADEQLLAALPLGPAAARELVERQARPRFYGLRNRWQGRRQDCFKEFIRQICLLLILLFIFVVVPVLSILQSWRLF